MNIYNSNNKCPKCGGKEIKDSHHSNITKCRSYIYHSSFDGEHIHRKCERCHYEWPERPLDVEKE